MRSADYVFISIITTNLHGCLNIQVYTYIYVCVYYVAGHATHVQQLQVSWRMRQNGNSSTPFEIRGKAVLSEKFGKTKQKQVSTYIYICVCSCVLCAQYPNTCDANSVALRNAAPAPMKAVSKLNSFRAVRELGARCQGGSK